MGSKARKSAKAMSLAFVLLDFQHAGVRIIRQEGNIGAPSVLQKDTALPDTDMISMTTPLTFHGKHICTQRRLNKKSEE